MKALRWSLAALIGIALLHPAPASADIYFIDLDSNVDVHASGDYTLQSAAINVFVTAPSTLTIASGASVEDWYGYGVQIKSGAKVNITGGDVSSALYADPGAAISISGGAIHSSVNATGSTVSISGGTIDQLVDAGGIGAPVTLSGGYMSDVQAWGPATMTGGSVEALNVLNSPATVSGGEIRLALWTFGGTVDLSGGNLNPGATLLPRGGGAINVHGSALLLGAPTPYATDLTSARLTGMLADGSPLDVLVLDYPPLPGTVTLINTVSTPEQAAEQLVGNVQALITGGGLNPGDGKTLVTQLNTAAQRFSAGNATAGVNMMNAFKNKVGALVNSGRLATASGQALKAAADAVIAAAK